jgi:chromosome segregation ATPase
MNPKSFATFLLLAMLIMSSGMALAQMRGGSAGGMGKGQPPSGAMQGPMAQQGTTAMGQAGTQDDRRRLMHTTSRQDHQYSACQQAMHSVQGDIGRMMDHNSAAPTSDDSNTLGAAGDLSDDLQNLEQDDDDFASGLNDVQKAVLQSQIKELQQKTKEMEALAKQVKTEMADRDSDPAVVHKDLKKLEKLSKDISKRQQEIGVALGITS